MGPLWGDGSDIEVDGCWGVDVQDPELDVKPTHEGKSLFLLAWNCSDSRSLCFFPPCGSQMLLLTYCWGLNSYYIIYILQNLSCL